MPRNKHGFLKWDALVGGTTEAYGVVIDDVKHEVTLSYVEEERGFVVQHLVTRGPDDWERTTWSFGQNLNGRGGARSHYKQVMAEIKALAA